MHTFLPCLKLKWHTDLSPHTIPWLVHIYISDDLHKVITCLFLLYSYIKNVNDPVKGIVTSCSLLYLPCSTIMLVRVWCTILLKLQDCFKLSVSKGCLRLPDLPDLPHWLSKESKPILLFFWPSILTRDFYIQVSSIKLQVIVYWKSKQTH